MRRYAIIALGLAILLAVPALATNSTTTARNLSSRSDSPGPFSVPSLDMVGNYADFATMLTSIGATPKTMMITEATIVDANATVPCTLRLMPVNGAILTPAAGVALTICSPDNIIAAPDQQIFDGVIHFQKPGTIYADWWGPDKTGATDAYADLNASIESGPPTSTVVFGAGEYTLETGLNVGTGGGINLRGNCGPKVEDGTYASTLKAGSNLTGTLLTYWPDQPYAGQLVIECLTLDGNNTASNGLEIRQSTGVLVKNVVTFGFTDRGQYVNGFNDCGYDCPAVYRGYGYFSNVTFDNCWSGYNGVGFSVERRGTPVFGNVTFNNCLAHLNDVGVFWKGDNSTSVYYGFSAKWSGGSVESLDQNADNFCTSFRVKDGVVGSIENTYTENYCKGDYHWWVSGNSFLDLSGGNAAIYWYLKYEDNSTICQGYSGSEPGEIYKLYGLGAVNRMCIGRIADKRTHGPPTFPQGTGPTRGYAVYKGQISTDVMGTRWLQVEEAAGEGGAGTAIVSGNHRWSPMDGRIIIPFTAATLNEGNAVIHWNEAKFLLNSVDMIITETFQHSDNAGYCEGLSGDPSPPGVSIGTASKPNSFIGRWQSNQGSATNMVAGKVIRAWDNNDTDAVLYWGTGSHKAFYMPGYKASKMNEANWDGDYPSSYLAIYPCPYAGTGYTWNSGAGYIVLQGIPLEFD